MIRKILTEKNFERNRI